MDRELSISNRAQRKKPRYPVPVMQEHCTTAHLGIGMQPDSLQVIQGTEECVGLQIGYRICKIMSTRNSMCQMSQFLLQIKFKEITDMGKGKFFHGNHTMEVKRKQ